MSIIPISIKILLPKYEFVEDRLSHISMKNIKGVLAQVQGTNVRVRQTIEYGCHLINELTGKIVFMKVSVNLMEGTETRRSNVKTLQL